jgi:hypothetical protein
VLDAESVSIARLNVTCEKGVGGRNRLDFGTVRSTTADSPGRAWSNSHRTTVRQPCVRGHQPSRV